MASSLGGFYASLVLKSDQASFDKSQKDLKSVEDQTKKTGLEFGKFAGDVIKGFAAIGAAAVGAAYAVSQVQGKMAITATGAGMQFAELNKWSVAMKLIGANAGDLPGKLSEINDAMTELAGGRSAKWEAMAHDLAMMGQIDINKFKLMSQTQRMETVAGVVANAQGDKRMAYINDAGKLFGEDFKAMLLSFYTPGSRYKNISDLERQAGASGAGLSGSEGLANMQAFNRLMVDLGQTFDLLGQKIGTGLRKPIEDLSRWLEEHKGDIGKFFEGISQSIGSFFSFIKDANDQDRVRQYEKNNPGFSSLSAKIAAKYGIQDPDSVSGQAEGFVALVTGHADEYMKKVQSVRSEQLSILSKGESSPVNLYVHVDKSGAVSVDKNPRGADYTFMGMTK